MSSSGGKAWQLRGEHTQEKARWTAGSALNTWKSEDERVSAVLYNGPIPRTVPPALAAERCRREGQGAGGVGPEESGRPSGREGGERAAWCG